MGGVGVEGSESYSTQFNTGILRPADQTLTFFYHFLLQARVNEHTIVRMFKTHTYQY